MTDDDATGRPPMVIPESILRTNPVDMVSVLTYRNDEGGVYGQAARFGAALHNAMFPDDPVKTLGEWEAEADDE